ARWTSPDPLDLVDGPNPYQYAQSRPLSFYDRLGLDAEADDERAPSVSLSWPARLWETVRSWISGEVRWDAKTSSADNMSQEEAPMSVLLPPTSVVAMDEKSETALRRLMLLGEPMLEEQLRKLTKSGVSILFEHVSIEHATPRLADMGGAETMLFAGGKLVVRFNLELVNRIAELEGYPKLSSEEVVAHELGHAVAVAEVVKDIADVLGVPVAQFSYSEALR